MTGEEAIRLAIALVALLALTACALRVYGVRTGSAPYLALVQGGAQLAVVGLALRGVFAAPPTAVLVIAVMITTATWTAAHRLRGFPQVGRSVAAACVVGAGLPLAIAFAAGVLPFSARYVVALGGIVIGNAMSAATLAGRGLLAGLVARREEVEAWLCLGATPRQAVLDIGRRAVAEALVPVIDQTRTTGLVTLPGAFIGALLGGASPADAARFQLVVLGTLLAAEAVAAVLVVALLGAPKVLPDADR